MTEIQEKLTQRQLVNTECLNTISHTAGLASGTVSRMKKFLLQVLPGDLSGTWLNWWLPRQQWPVKQNRE